ncbi:MAG: response regulator [Gammaproteobacteria bacterium]|nr:response regulator [Gammaproteobacteria bacterium]
MGQDSGDRNTFTALVVDDSTTLRRLMDLTLTPLGIDVEFTDNGEDAVVLVKNKEYDIVFLDVILPGIDGYRVCKEIKGDRRTKATPVIMLTSKDSTFDKVRGMMAGTDVYLTKPLERAHLLHAINKYLPLERRNGMVRVQQQGA